MIADPGLDIQVSVEGDGDRRSIAAVAASLAASRPVAAVRQRSAEILTALAFVSGWLLVTAGVARLTSSVAWLFSLGALALSLGGWKLLAQFIWNGLYALTRDDG